MANSHHASLAGWTAGLPRSDGEVPARGRAGVAAEESPVYRKPMEEAGLDARFEAASWMDARAGLNAGFEPAVVVGSPAQPSPMARR